MSQTWRSILAVGMGVSCLGLAATLARADAPAGAYWLQDKPSAPATAPAQAPAAAPTPAPEPVKAPAAQEPEKAKAPAPVPAVEKPKPAPVVEKPKPVEVKKAEAPKAPATQPAAAAAQAPVAPAPTIAPGATPGHSGAVMAPTPAPVPVTAKTPPAEPKPAALSDSSFSIPVSGIELVYDSSAHGLIPIEQVMQGVQLTLAQTKNGMAAPGVAPADSKLMTLPLADVAKLSEQRFTASGIQSVSQAVVAYFNQRGIVGVAIGPHPQDIDAQGKDLRGQRTTLRMIVRIGVVREIRTLASGDRIPVADRINPPQIESIKDNSPVQNGDAIHKDALDDYLGYVNRHPNRRVDVALSRGVEDGTIALDYMVAENKPWLAYYQISNTGTPETKDWRHRFGFNTSQLTGNDDILDFQYTTAADFDQSHSVQISYEAPVFVVPKLRWKAFGTYGQYTASDVGAVSGNTFDGQSWSAGGQLIYNLLQKGDFFIDGIAGARWEDVKVTPEIGTRGHTSFFLPTVGLSTGYRSLTWNADGSVSVDWNATSIADTGSDQVILLGRSLADTYFATLHWDTGVSFYLEPLFNHEAWARAEMDNNAATLAHEIAVTFSGQYGFSGRQPANYESVAGGMFSVRGYPESFAAADTVLILRTEYRLHVPRLLPVGAMASVKDPMGETFNLARTQPYGRPDWDLLFRTFVDLGQTINTDRQSFEKDATLVSAGVGVEMLLKYNISLRADWGIALNDAQDSNSGSAARVTAGSSRFHFLCTFMY